MSTSDLLQFDATAAEAASQRGQANVLANTSESWRASVRKAIEAVAKTHARFTSDHVWMEIETNHKDVLVHNNSALGPVLQKAARENVMRVCGAVKSTRESSHRRFITEWESLIFVKE